MTASPERPPIPQMGDTYDRDLVDQALLAIQQRIEVLEQEAGPDRYVISNNSSPTRTLDVSTATLGDVTAFLATLAEDLKGAGRI